MEFQEQDLTDAEKDLVEFVTTHCDRWREWRDTNYLTKWDEYERLYYGIWADEDKTRTLSVRSWLLLLFDRQLTTK